MKYQISKENIGCRIIMLLIIGTAIKYYLWMTLTNSQTNHLKNTLQERGMARGETWNVKVPEQGERPCRPWDRTMGGAPTQWKQPAQYEQWAKRSRCRADPTPSWWGHWCGALERPALVPGGSSSESFAANRWTPAVSPNLAVPESAGEAPTR